MQKYYILVIKQSKSRKKSNILITFAANEEYS